MNERIFEDGSREPLIPLMCASNTWPTGPGTARSSGVVFQVVREDPDEEEDLGLWAREEVANDLASRLADAHRQSLKLWPHARVVQIGAQGETTFGVELEPGHLSLAMWCVRRRLVNP